MVARRADNQRTVTFDFTDQSGLGIVTVGRRVKLSVLEQPGQPPFYNIADLERRHGSSSDAVVYARADSEPVLEIARDTLEQRPRLALRLTSDELERLALGLRRWGLPGSSLLPQQLEAGSQALRPGLQR